MSFTALFVVQGAVDAMHVVETLEIVRTRKRLTGEG
jgi:hypothetical protein